AALDFLNGKNGGASAYGKSFFELNDNVKTNCTFSPFDTYGHSLAVFGIGLKYLIPFMLLCLVCSALPALLQAGFVLATEALKP
ncbi:hypothetical protein MJH54_34445, partial [Salmonella enterica subsp. enterica serovar Montevideo]|nr:hypothetical protein [Salmonella enterica subsp. enterica serovar Montevideo]